jgi:hypothetical protein
MVTFLTILVLKWHFSREFVPICIIFYNFSVKIAKAAISEFVPNTNIKKKSTPMFP